MSEKYVNVYDFDKTIYSGDSSVDFWKYCANQNKSLYFMIPRLSGKVIKYKCGWCSKTELKEEFFGFLSSINNIDKCINEFWRKNSNKINAWYLDQKMETDVIISASPEFLLKPICNKLGVHLIASRVDKKTGLFDGENCKGDEKVKRFHQAYPDTQIDKFYSDSISDLPLAKLSQEAYIVSKDGINKWNL